MTAPDGSRFIFAAQGDSHVTLSVGQILPNGYRVVAIAGRVVELIYPDLNTTARLEFPEPPPHEIR